MMKDYDLGGDLGRQDVMVMYYQPEGKGGLREKNYYSKYWGWIRWEEYSIEGILQKRSDFNRIIKAQESVGVFGENNGNE